MSSDGITEVVQMGLDGSRETKRFLQLLEQFCVDHGYPGMVGVLIVPLLPDGFGVMGAGKGGLLIDQEHAFEYLIDIGEQLREFADK